MEVRGRVVVADPVGLVGMAHAVRTGEFSLDEFVAALQHETLYVQRPERPGVFVAELDDGEQWASVFSTPERMALFTGTAEWASLRGDDLVSLLPVGVNVVLDPSEPHAVAIESIHLPRQLLPPAG